MSEDKKSEDNLINEFQTLGENLVNTFRAAWDNPERQRLQKEIEDVLAVYFLEEKIKGPTKVRIGVAKDKLNFKFSELGEEELAALKREYLIEEEFVDNYWDNDELIENNENDNYNENENNSIDNISSEKYDDRTPEMVST